MKLLSKENYGDKSWVKFSSYAFAGRTGSVPLVRAEVFKAAIAFPLAFVLRQDRYILKAILSVDPEGNCFVAPDGRWLGSYIPAFFRSHPFKLSKVMDREELFLCVDEDSGLVQEGLESGELFFNEKGELSPRVQEVKTFLEHVAKDEIQTQTAVKAIADAGLMTAWPLNVRIRDKETAVQGYYCIDEPRLNQLSDPDFLRLQKSGSLPIIYGQMISMNTIGIFAKLAEIQDRLSRVQSPEPESDLGEYGFGADDMIGV